MEDKNGNPMGGVTACFAAPTSGATAALSAASAQSNSSGVASVTATANSTVGSYNVTASVGALTASFALTNNGGSPASVTATGGTPQAAMLSTVFPALLQATVKDAGGNPIGGVTVNFSAPTSGASATLCGGERRDQFLPESPVLPVQRTAQLVLYNVTAKVGSFTATPSRSPNTTFSPCDINQDGLINVVDTQAIINEALGHRLAANDLTLDGVVNVVDIQIVTNGALLLGCFAK